MTVVGDLILIEAIIIEFCISIKIHLILIEMIKCISIQLNYIPIEVQVFYHFDYYIVETNRNYVIRENNTVIESKSSISIQIRLSRIECTMAFCKFD